MIYFLCSLIDDHPNEDLAIPGNKDHIQSTINLINLLIYIYGYVLITEYRNLIIIMIIIITLTFLAIEILQNDSLFKN
jgi:hypothetical protein